MLSLLIADDQREIREGLRALIAWEDYGIGDVRDAADGTQALDILRRDRPDIALCDIRMPGLSGLDLIRIAVEEGLPTRFVFVSGFDDFDYVKQALKYDAENYLLKPVDTAELKATMDQVVRKVNSREREAAAAAVSGVAVIRENLLNRFVAGGISYGEFKEKAALSGIDVTDGSVVVLVCAPSWDARLYARGKELAEERGAIAFFDDGGRCVFAFRAGEAQDDQDLLESAVAFAKTLAADRGRDNDRFRAGIGLAGRSFRALGLCFETARRALDVAGLVGREALVKYADCVPAAVASGAAETEGANETVAALVRACSIGERALALSLARSLSAAATYVAFFALLRGIDPASLGSEGTRRAFLRCRDALGLSRSAEERRSALGACIESIVAERGEGGLYGPPVDDIIGYVERNLAADLSLKTLGPVFGLSPAYIGTVFKERTGRAFSDFLVERRTERARRLLAETDLKVARIADVCGFGSNVNYFFTVFKKLTGSTPAEYRKSTAGERDSPRPEIL